MNIGTDEWISLQKNLTQALSGKIAAALNLNSKYLVVACPDSEGEIIDQLKELKTMNLIKFEADLKVTRMFDSLDGTKFPLKIVVFYKGILCGYAFGEIIKSDHSIVIHPIEKRYDCHKDLEYKFLSIAMEVVSTYILFLKAIGLAENLRHIRFVNPLEHIIAYYEKHGFYIGNYNYKGIECTTATYDATV